MTTEQEPIDELDNDEGEEDSAPEPLDVPDNPNEPVEVVTDEQRTQNRKAKRAERQSQYRAAQEEAARLRAEVEQLRRQPAYQPPPQQQQQHNPHVQRLHEIDEQQRRLHAEYRARASQPGFKEDSDEYRDFERRNNQLQTARMAAVVDAKQSSVQQPNVQELARQIAWTNFQSEHHDIFNHDQARTWAWGEYYKRKAEGKPDTKEAAEELLDAARRRFGLTPRKGIPAPDAATRQRFSGVSSRAAGAGSSPGAIKMDAHDKKMARIAFMKEGVTEAQAYQKWANTAGKEREKLNRSKGG